MLAKQIGTVQKKKVERKLEQSEKVFRALVDHSLDVVCIIDKNGILTYQSPSFENVLGFGPNELLGKNAFEFIHPEDFKILIHLYIEPGIERGTGFMWKPLPTICLRKRKLTVLLSISGI
jgi:PAS domain-containing protein